MLSNTDEDRTGEFADTISGFLNDMLKCCIIDETTTRCLWPDNAKPSRIYVLPKMHKPGNPGRLIVSFCGAPTERISWFVECHLHPPVEKLSSYVKDTVDFLIKP